MVQVVEGTEQYIPYETQEVVDKKKCKKLEVMRNRRQQHLKQHAS